ncbi:hypothetical protein FGADI_731 [Fusarium gaditjirri]|uniref:Nitrate reductase n=1 Tax=Fusarium gaditjirri TaxID=282569 RepID=A0A8H4TMU1_9HYPO|nr:hypothetical protein FGADI_731 [Fusarium gaditjirri]
MDTCSEAPSICSRDSIEDIWGSRTPYIHQWPTRVDHACDEEPEKWVQSACVLCSWKAINSKERLTHPMIRRNGKLERATWDEAMGLIVKKSKLLVKKLTAHSIAFYTSGQLFLEEYYVLALIGKAGLNTLHMDGNTRLCTVTAAASMRESFGSDGQPGSYTDIDYTDCLFMSSRSTGWPNSPEADVVDPRYSESASKATLHLAPKIGTNLALLNGIQHLMFKNGWINQDYVSKHVVGLEDLILGETQSLLSSALQGVYQSNQATASACQINNIHLLRGLIGKAGSGIFQMNGQPTAQNNRETGCDGEFPGFRNHQNGKHMQELADLWNINNIQVPYWNEPTHIHNMLTFMEKGSIRMVWVSGTNPLVSLPNLQKTASIADVVLPAAQWGEKTGCFTNVDRIVHLSHKAVEPPGEAKPDFEIFLDYSRRMEFKNTEGGPLTPYGHDLQTGVPYSEGYYKELRPAGRAILKTCDYIPPYEDPDAQYPLRLSTGRNLYHFHTRTKTGRTALQKACPEPEIRISEKDAEISDVKTGNMVVIKSRRGEVEMKVKVGKISQGQAFIPFHFGYWDTKDGRARAANELTITEWDPISKQPTFKSGAISIEKVPDDGPTAKERQSEALAKAEKNDAAVSNVTESGLSNRARQLETWLGESYESILLLRDITEQLLDHLVADSEAHSGVRILIRITKDTTKRLKPRIDKFGENQARGRHAAHTLRDALFPKSDDAPGQLQVLEALRSLQVYLAHLRVGLEALNPVSQAMWDEEFFQAVLYAISQVKRMQDWVTTQIKVRAPQALLVPCKVS